MFQVNSANEECQTIYGIIENRIYSAWNFAHRGHLVKKSRKSRKRFYRVSNLFGWTREFDPRMTHAAVLHGPSPRNIYIIGAQSSGKTTLTAALKLYFEQKSEGASGAMTAQQPHILGEVARQALQDHHSTGKDVSESQSRALEMQTSILEVQYEGKTPSKALG